MVRFAYDIVLESTDVCNLVQDAQNILSHVTSGDRLVFMGRRNMGKTSLIVSKVIPAYRAANPNSLIVFVDLMGVKSLEQISRRMQAAFEKGMAKIKPARSFVEKLMRQVRHVRPTMSIDAMTGSPEFSLGLAIEAAPIPFTNIIEQIGNYHRDAEALLVIDEFQDIAEVEEAEALFRNALQHLPADLPVVLMGSKKHVLARIFAEPGAPLAGWGRHVEISLISAEDFLPYINARLNTVVAEVDLPLVQRLLTVTHNNPESVNMVGDWWLRHRQGAGKLSEIDLNLALEGITAEKSSSFREYLAQFTEKEELVLRAIARSEIVVEPLGASFRAKVGMSPGGLGPLLKRLEHRAIIYRTERGLIVGDAIFGHWLKATV